MSSSRPFDPSARRPSARLLPQFLPDGETLSGPVEIPGPRPIMEATAFHAHGVPYLPDQHIGGPSEPMEGDRA